jgi:alkylation response protein AidB-like acyl-CoA dehydrogenase
MSSQIEFLNQLRDIGKEAELLCESIAKSRCLPTELVNKLKATGAFKLWVGKEYGGSQTHILDLIAGVQLLSYYNGALGWVLSVTGTAGLASGYLKPENAQNIFGDSMALTGGWAAPMGKARKVDGGLIVSGNWSWGSGITHCTHIVGGVMISDVESKTTRSAVAYLNPSDVLFEDNWHVLGLEGSNSIDYGVSELFVPDSHWTYFPEMKPTIDDPLYRFSFLGALASGVASVGLGIANRAIDEIIKLSQSKIPNGARNTLANRPVTHYKIAQLKAKYHSSKAFLENAIKENWKEAEIGRINKTTKSNLRLAASYTVQESLSIVQSAYKIGGGSSIWNGVKLQDLLRDMHVVSQHGMISDHNIEIAGRIAFGLDVNEWLL